MVWSSNNDNPAAWAELIKRLKEGILLAFDTAVTQKEEEVRRSESQRQMPGWNFCNFFILKVSSVTSLIAAPTDTSALGKPSDVV